MNTILFTFISEDYKEQLIKFKPLCHTSIFTGPYPFASAKPRVQDRSNMGKAPNWTQTLCSEKQIQEQQQRTSSPPMKDKTFLHGKQMQIR